MTGRGVATAASDDRFIAAADKTFTSVLRIWEGGFTVVPMALVAVLIGLNIKTNVQEPLFPMKRIFLYKCTNHEHTHV